MDDFMKDLQSKNKEFSDEYKEMIKQYYEKLMNNPAELQKQLDALKQNNPNMQIPNFQAQGPNNRGIDPEGGITITPEKFCCMKTTDENGQKIFINLVSHEEVPAPAEEHILELENKQGVRIPLSLSDKYEDFDVKGNICQVYDCILNPSVLKKSETEPLILRFLMELISQRIKERFKHTININGCIKMKNMLYKGKEVRQQRIRARRVKIEEIIDKGEKKSSSKSNDPNVRVAAEVSKEVNERGKTPNWNIIIIKDEKPSGLILKEIHKKKNEIIGNNGKLNMNILLQNEDNSSYCYFNGFNANPKYGNGILLLIELELLTKSSGINLNIADECVAMYCGKFYSLELNFPFKVNSKESTSFFVSEDRILYIYLPFYEQDINEWKQINSKENEGGNTVPVTLSEDYLFDVVQ